MIRRSAKAAFLILAASGCGAGAGEESLSESALDVVGGPDPDVVRFLEQSSFGPSTSSIAHVQAIGVPAAIAEQLAAPPSTYSGATSAQAQFFANALNGQDQLRQRTAFALGQIFVVSTAKLKTANAVWPYLNILSKDAFGSFEQLLYDVTTNPSMGTYLDMVNDDGQPAGAASPNENYARELLQLFSIGLWELHPDGTLAEDAQHRPIPTYTQEKVEAFAHVFTGWTYGSAAGCPGYVGKHNAPNLLSPLLPCDINHDPSPQALFGGASTRAVWTAAQAMASPLDAAAHTSGAIASVASHPNVGPFIGKQLIQHLVTSNPSPAYVARVSAAFADDGSATHARGNLGAVVRAILLDPEARGPSVASPGYGHLREPVLYVTGLLRLFDAESSGYGLATYGAQMGQELFKAPSVFNYYPPDYKLPGSDAGLYAPELAILNTGTAIARANFANRLFHMGLGPDTIIDTSMVPTDPAGLTAWINQYMMHGAMSADMSAILLAAVSPPALPAADRLRRGLYLAASSMQYQIER